MTKKTLYFLLIFSSIFSFRVEAQNEVDALRYSTYNLTGSAKFSSMGGAFGALGGEFSALSQNPAGIGMYQFSEISFTPIINFNSTKSYNNSYSNIDYKSAMKIGNLGLILSIPKKDSPWKRFNIGIGWNQLSNYDNSIKIQLFNEDNSIIDRIIDLTNGVSNNDLTNGLANTYSQMAWNTYLIDPSYQGNQLIDGEYVSNFANTSRLQTKNIRSSGDMTEFIFTVGASYEDKLYVGATVGVPTINYYEYSEYIEQIENDTSNNLRNMLLSEEIVAYGDGINLKIGAIYRLAENIKIGGSLHTPTFFSIEEDYNTSTTAFFKDSTLEYSMGYLNPFSYDLITPFKSSISASTTITNILIAAELEYIDYSSAEFFTNNFDTENQIISSIYQNTENIKIGAELKISPLVFRVGYAKFGSAYRNYDFSRENYSYGMGINNGNYYFDFAYVLNQGENQTSLYGGDFVEPTRLVNTNHNFLFTVGLRY